MAIEAKRGSVGLKEVAHGGARAGEHKNCERDLSDQQNSAGSCPLRCGAAGARRLDHLADVRAGKLQGGREAGENSNDDRNGGAEEKDGSVQRDRPISDSPTARITIAQRAPAGGVFTPTPSRTTLTTRRLGL